MKKLLYILPLLFSLACGTSEKLATTDSTEVHIRNVSERDSVCVYLTLQAPNSVIGHFGIKDTLGSKSQGYFWAHKDSVYSTNNNGQPFVGFVISFDTTNLSCEAARGTKFTTGVNIFEGSLNVEYESFDISCVDGQNSVMQVSVDSTSGWQTGESTYTETFVSAQNDDTLTNNSNIRGVFPYLCTTCTGEQQDPKNCFGLGKQCNTEQICQTSRRNLQGGVILLQYKQSTSKM
jgi:hypothetical protein